MERDTITPDHSQDIYTFGDIITFSTRQTSSLPNGKWRS